MTLLANEATHEQPLVIVVDEFPYLTASHPPIEGVLQTLWDRTLEHKQSARASGRSPASSSIPTRRRRRLRRRWVRWKRRSR